jgi:hypothetical protein
MKDDERNNEFNAFLTDLGNREEFHGIVSGEGELHLTSTPRVAKKPKQRGRSRKNRKVTRKKQ